MVTESTGMIIGSFETIRTITKNTNAVITIIIIVIFPFESFIVEDVSNTVFKMQLEIYKRWEKKVKAIKSFDNLVI